MPNLEKAPVSFASCPGGGNCATCPALCGSKALVLETSSISVTFDKPAIVGKIDFQTRQKSFISSRPVPEVRQNGCKECGTSFLGSCSKHSKAA